MTAHSLNTANAAGCVGEPDQLPDLLRALADGKFQPLDVSDGYAFAGAGPAALIHHAPDAPIIVLFDPTDATRGFEVHDLRDLDDSSSSDSPDTTAWLIGFDGTVEQL